MTVIPLTDPIWSLFWKISSFLINGGRHELPIHLSPGCPAASTRTRPKNGSGGRNHDPAASACENEPDTSGSAGGSRRRAARHGVLVRLGLLDGGPLSGLDR